MSGFAVFAAILCAALAAMDVVLFAMTGTPYALGGAVFCGSLVVVNLAMGLRT